MRDERSKLADDFLLCARAGEDFSALAEQYSEDPSTRDTGGDLGIRAVAGSPAAMRRKAPMLAQPLEERAMKLEPLQTADAFRFKDALVILQLQTRQPSRYVALEPVENEMIERVRADKLQKAKEKWLRDLRRRTHVDVRL